MGSSKNLRCEIFSEYNIDNCYVSIARLRTPKNNLSVIIEMSSLMPLKYIAEDDLQCDFEELVNLLVSDIRNMLDAKSKDAKSKNIFGI
jgi:hypothetical protein